MVVTVMVARVLAVVVASVCAAAICRCAALREDLNLLCLSGPSRANESLPIMIMSPPNSNQRPNMPVFASHLALAMNERRVIGKEKKKENCCVGVFNKCWLITRYSRYFECFDNV